MATFERPAPDINKISEAWRVWTVDDEALPGRTMADLKIGGLDYLLETIAHDAEQLAPALEAWTSWEKGKLGPNEALDALTKAGLDDIVAALSEA